MVHATIPSMPHIQTQFSTLHKKLAWNTGAQLVARGVSALASFVITLFIARRFGAAGFGDFVKITTYTAFFYLLADFGFNAIYLQHTPPSSNTGTDSAWEDLLGLRLVVSAILVIAASVILWLLPRGTEQGYTNFVRIGIVLFTPSIAFQAIITTTNALFQKHLRYDLATIATSVGAAIAVVLIILVTLPFIRGATVMWATTVFLIESAVAAGIALSLTRRLQKISHLSFSLVRMRNLFFASVPLGLTLLFNLVYFRVDSIILTLTRTTAEVGIYGLAYKIFELPLVIPTFFMNALYPVMLEVTGDLGKETRKNFSSLIGKTAALLFVASCVVVLIVWFCAPIIAWIRTDFFAGVAVLRVLSLGLPFFFLSSLTMWTLIAKKQQTLLAVVYCVCMFVNAGLNWIFIPKFGYMAAAWITVASEGLVLLLSSLSVLRILAKQK